MHITFAQFYPIVVSAVRHSVKEVDKGKQLKVKVFKTSIFVETKHKGEIAYALTEHDKLYTDMSYYTFGQSVDVSYISKLIGTIIADCKIKCSKSLSSEKLILARKLKEFI